MGGYLKTIILQELNWRHFAAFLLLFASVTAFALSGKLHNLNNSFTDLRFRLLSSAPSGDVVIVAIDSKSLQALRQWPWPRSYHGELVTALDAAGAKNIAFDIDFSSASYAEHDAAFAGAIETAEADVFLAAFQQPVSQDLPDVIAEMVPTAVLQAPAYLASVNYRPEADGTVRRASSGHEFSFGIMPSFAAALGEGPADTSEFWVNFGIDIDRIQYISYVDVLNGEYDPADVNGKNVLVGATAVELGDEYALPVYGIRSGVALNALAFETVYQNKRLLPVPGWIGWTIAGILAFLVCGLYRYRSIVSAITAAFVLAAGTFASSLVLQSQMNLIPATAQVFVSIALICVYLCYLELHKRGRNLFRARIEIRQNYALLDALVSENHEGVMTINYRGEVLMCNARAAYLLGLEHNGVIGQDMASIRPDMADLLNLETESRGVIARRQLATEVEDETRFVDVTVSRVCIEPVNSIYERRSEPRLTTVFAIHDITAQKQAELAERDAKEALEEALKAKTLLISTMSHELRTPLNAIIGFSQLYEQQAFGPLGADEYVEYAGMINDSGQTLLSVVNNMLLAGKIQSNDLKLSPQETPCRDIFEGAVAKTLENSQWRDRKVVHDYADMTWSISADQEYLQIALMHLIENALKFSDSESTVTLRAYAAGGEFVFEVADNGPGAQTEDLESLKTMLTQGDSSLSRQVEGTGMGLFLADQIARLHGGNLRLESSEEGFVARIILPQACSAGDLTQAA